LIFLALIQFTISLINFFLCSDIYFNHLSYYSKTSGCLLVSLKVVQIIAGILSIAFLVHELKSSEGHFLNCGYDWVLVRTFIYCAVIPFIVCSFVYHYRFLKDDSFLLVDLFQTILSILLSVWIILSIRRVKIHNSLLRSFLRTSDVIAFNLIFTVLLIELILHIYDRLYPSVIFADTMSIKRAVNTLKGHPGSYRFNFSYNSNGFYDQEFLMPGPNDCVIGLIGDSNAIGIVPYDYNFATVAEKLLQKKYSTRYHSIAIDNFGVPAVGMKHYAYILENEVEKYHPSIVVLGVTISNDLYGFETYRRDYVYLQDWFFWRFTTRFFSLYKEGYLNKKNFTEKGTYYQPSLQPQIPDYVTDWRKENPSCSNEKHLETGKRMLSLLNSEKQVDLSDFLKTLQYFGNRIGRDKLVVILFPMEIQVDDHFFNEVQSAVKSSDTYIKDLPQQKIIKFCEKNHLLYLDLMTALRVEAKNGRVFQYNEDHLNARGNRIAGQCLADFLIENFFEKASGQLTIPGGASARATLKGRKTGAIRLSIHKR